MSETTHPGLFRGTLVLVNAGAATNQLQVINGDTITATYFDVSGGSNVTATATIDTVPPGITNVAATTDFYNARVTWATSKPADSAVQYGSLDQPPINSVYVGALVTNHSVTVSGLLANRDYHYLVVSRDQAGNTVVDDNHGNYYTFSTLKAPTPPWFDRPGGRRERLDGDSGSFDWFRRQLDAGHAQQRAGEWRAFGNERVGQRTNQIDFWASTYLYSPIIDLSGLKSATLTFSNVCDFSEATEDGVVFISTNSSMPPSLSLPVAADLVGNVASGWQPEIVDLTPWVGQTVQIVFYYQAFYGASQYYGWLLDDIGITGVVAGGNVSITKNLGQGSWALSSLSPIGLVPVQSGTAPSITLSNLPAAQYVVQFGDVPFYQTPPARTNTLVLDGTLYFTGNYTFPDANSNGISDSFELHYFGSISTNRTQFTDTDRDGMSDYAEFIAGTDPTNAASRFYFTRITQTNRVVEMEWTVVTNRLYQISASTGLKSWSPATAWLQASNDPTMNCSATNSGSGAQFYRVQVLP